MIVYTRCISSKSTLIAIGFALWSASILSAQFRKSSDPVPQTNSSIGAALQVSFTNGIYKYKYPITLNFYRNADTTPKASLAFDPAASANASITLESNVGDVWTIKRVSGPNEVDFDTYTVPTPETGVSVLKYAAHPANKFLTPLLTSGPNPDFRFAEGMQVKFQTSSAWFVTSKDVEIRPGSPKVKLVTISDKGDGLDTFTVKKAWSGMGYSLELSKAPGTFLAISPNGGQVSALDGTLITTMITDTSPAELKQSASLNIIPSPTGAGVVMQKPSSNDLMWYDSTLYRVFRFKEAFADSAFQTESLTPIVSGDSASKIVYSFSRDAFGAAKSAPGSSNDFLKWQSEFQPDPGAKDFTNLWIEQSANASFFEYAGFANHLRQGYNVLWMEPLNLQDHGLEGTPPFIFLTPDAKSENNYYTAKDGKRMAKDMILSPEIHAIGSESTQSYSTENEYQTSLGVSLGMEAQAGDPKSDSLSVSRSGSFSQNRKDASSAGRVAHIRTKWASDCWLHLNKDTVLLAPEFQKALFQLAGSTDYDSYKRFFRRFGTHYAVSALFGGYAMEESYLTTSSALAELSKSASISGKQGATVDGVGGSTEGSATFGSDALSNVTTEEEFTNTEMVGGSGGGFNDWTPGVDPKSYAPIKALMRPIYELAYPELLSQSTASTPTLLDAQTLTATRARLKEMLTRYLDQESDDLFFRDQALVVVIVSVDSLKCTDGNDQYNANIAVDFAYAPDVFGGLFCAVVNQDTGEPMNFDGTPFTAKPIPEKQSVLLWEGSSKRENYKQIDESMEAMTIGQSFKVPMMVEKTLQTKKDGEKIWFPSLKGQAIRLLSAILDDDGLPGDQAIDFTADVGGDLDVADPEKLAENLQRRLEKRGDLDLTDLETSGTKSYDLPMTGLDGSTFILKVTATLQTMRDPGAVLGNLPPFPNVSSTAAANPMPVERAKILFHDRYTLRDPTLYNNKPLALREWHYGRWELIDRGTGATLVTYERTKEKLSKDGSRVNPQNPFTLTSSDADLTVLKVGPALLEVTQGAKKGKSYKLWDADVVRYDPTFAEPAPVRGDKMIYLQKQRDGAWVIRFMDDKKFSRLWFPGEGPDSAAGTAITLTQPWWNDDGGFETVWKWNIPANIPADGIDTKITSSEYNETRDFIRVLPPGGK